MADEEQNNIWVYIIFKYLESIRDTSQVESEKINCETTKCENCQNHNYCDFEPHKSEGQGMTREEAIAYGKRVIDLGLNDETQAFCELAIKALEQQPCEDAISRAAAVKVASGYCHPANIAKELAKLPPVTPKPETAHWIKVPDEETFFCSKCNARLYDEQTYLPLNFCPNCGAKMIEQQGSEG